MITIQFQPGSSVDQRLADIAEFIGGLADAVGMGPVQAALNARADARQAVRDKAAADKAEAEKHSPSAKLDALAKVMGQRKRRRK